jgi:hypothetical protein
MTGRALGVMDSQSACKYVDFKYDANTVTQAAFIAEFPCRIVAVRGRPRVAGNDGSAVTFTFFKCASGIAAASGTALIQTGASSYDLKGTADTNQVISLVPDVTTRTFQAGDSLNIVLTGTATSAVGVVTFTFDPLV